ncbi:MAG TPA: hypothetical protein VFS25_16080 [Chitinophaga sp.]|uniref:hypothetical protein n=1 Tax=Chitinophaga sp. TaxID=1869181 RepID=UPI002DB9ABC2|nr:hypothetical protein [Chitinophaga sp.]HEU4554366.1 hypothetical protein [Chitinophaga sp.]
MKPVLLHWLFSLPASCSKRHMAFSAKVQCGFSILRQYKWKAAAPLLATPGIITGNRLAQPPAGCGAATG